MRTKTVPGQTKLSVILGEIEEQARWRYTDRLLCAEVADRVPALVKSLRHAAYYIGILERSYNHSESAKQIISEITAILNGEKQ